MGDPIGIAIKDYYNGNKNAEIIISSDLCDDDVIPLIILCRTFEEMSEMEKLAISKAKGKVLDVGAGCGNHALAMLENGCSVTAIDISDNAVEHMKSRGINAEKIDFFELKDQKFDTITFFMNGIGIAGNLSNLKHTLKLAFDLLEPNGTILFDSSDISYLYEDDEGGMWMDLNNEYFGNFKFQMSYKEEKSDWFEWLYVDFNTLKQTTDALNYNLELLYEDDNAYLAKLTL